MSRLKRVVYTDENNWKRCSLVPEDTDESEGKYGIPLGPPDINKLDWGYIKLEINNTLVDMGILSWTDFQANQQSVVAAMNVVKRALFDLYRQDHNDKMEK
jgi:hypothetical protein